MFCLPPWYFPLIFSPFPFIPFHYSLYSPNEWDHIMFVLLRLTYFTQHNTLQFHPHRSKWWVFVVSNGWVIFHRIHRPHLLYPFTFRWTLRLLPQFGYCGRCCYKHRGAGVPVRDVPLYFWIVVYWCCILQSWWTPLLIQIVCVSVCVCVYNLGFSTYKVK